jgi:hypothetical protein
MKGSRPWCVDLGDRSLSARKLDLSGGVFIPGEIQGRWQID